MWCYMKVKDVVVVVHESMLLMEEWVKHLFYFSILLLTK